MSTLSLPFNYNPESTVFLNGDNVNYTVPTGKWALVQIFLKSSVTLGMVITPATTQFGYGANDSSDFTGQFWLKEGEVLDSTLETEKTTTTNTAVALNETAEAKCDIGGTEISCFSRAGLNNVSSSAIGVRTVSRFSAIVTLYVP